MNDLANNQTRSEDPKPAGGIQLGQSIRASVIATIVLAIIVSGVYPAIVWGLARALFRDKADGSLIGKNGLPVSDEKLAVGSSLIGQNFSDAKYFHPRPSAAGSGYDPTASGGSNLGPTSKKLMFGTTKDVAYTVFAADKSHMAIVPVSGRAQVVVSQATKTTLVVTTPGATGTRTYTLDASIADPNTAVNFHGRTVRATTIAPGATVELKLNDKTPVSIIGVNVFDQEVDGVPSAVDTSGNKITLSDSSGTVINVDPKTTLIVVNGKAGAAVGDITTTMTVHAVISFQMDGDGIADRVIHYCQDNKIDYKSTVPDSSFMDADGLDDVNLITAFNAATMPTITPDAKKPIPADAVTASGSGLDPHISPDNAKLQAPRVADTRKLSVDKVNQLIQQYTDGPSLGFIGDAGVNVLRLNLALDQTSSAPAQNH